METNPTRSGDRKPYIIYDILPVSPDRARPPQSPSETPPQELQGHGHSEARGAGVVAGVFLFEVGGSRDVQMRPRDPRRSELLEKHSGVDGPRGPPSGVPHVRPLGFEVVAVV